MRQKVGLIPPSRRVTKTLKPLIFVPGIMGSTLASRMTDGYLDYFWPPPYSLPLAERAEKMLHGLQSDIRSKPDDNLSVEAMGLYPWAYDYLINAIESWGYRLNVNFWIFPYDWRQSNRISGKFLADFIKEKVSESNPSHDGVDIINHSMGGFVTRAAALMYKAPIKRVVYIASPHYGCPLSYFGLHPDIPFDEFPQFINLPPVDETLNALIETARGTTNMIDTEDVAATSFNDQMEEAFRRFPSMYELLPDPFYLETKPVLYTDAKPVLGAEETYLKGEWKFKDDSAVSRVKDAMKFKKEELGKDLPGSNNLIIYGIDEPTDDTTVYETRFFISSTGPEIRHTANYQFSYPYDSGQRGDSWVPKLSAMGSMSGMPSKNSKAIQDIHTFLPNDTSAIEAIWEFLIGNGS